MKHLADQRVAILSLDEFYRELTPEEHDNASDLNFDEPAAFNLQCMLDCIDRLKSCEATDVPVYDFCSHSPLPDQVRHVKPADVVIVEGILVLHIPEILTRMDMKIYVDTDDDVRLARRIRRDTAERGRDVESVITQYTRFVKPAFEKYVVPSKNVADIIVPWSGDNSVAVDLITQHIRSKLSVHDLRRIYPNLHVMPSTMQTRGMHTKIRNRATSRSDFVFYADRLIRLVVETALGHLPFEETTVTTPVGENYDGVSFAPKLCGVSVIRSGEAMENALRTCCMGVKIGKILIHRSGDRCQELAYEKVPHDISERHVLLMDPILATGESAVRAIEVLMKKRNVEESKIIMLTLIAAPTGIQKVCATYPKVKVITSEIDNELSSNGEVKPGVGDFGDRYFGTTCCYEEGFYVRTPKGGSSETESKSSE
eukprot:CAMPEP_0194481594 /NCGR_PEP_ID=MMETSP0253-20130528/3940_1 /TAXON_ID=2966 /ORGANISM="Noctiluca scintillans" /LENGTH=426 /DNA_ID=CAMNT_0039321087 /DNA_START=192 /DNA_END=1472 /DNA_ORIENTATION=-